MVAAPACWPGFIALIPFTKLRHLLTTPANYLFADRGPTGKLVTLDLEDEEAESFGAGKLAELTWKDLFDGDACTFCKRCQDRCPASATDKPLSPMKVVNQLQQLAFTAPEAGLIETVGKETLVGLHHLPRLPGDLPGAPSSTSPRSSRCAATWC